MKWKYIIHYSKYEIGAEQLNRYGNEGWELCGITVSTPCSEYKLIMYHFKSLLNSEQNPERSVATEADSSTGDD